ncbi:MAG TPA: ROK family transcriptional regulator [Firmicutes bacterium]|nr:ROK family transcriptional regulator [Bacillota bacterium]
MASLKRTADSTLAKKVNTMLVLDAVRKYSPLSRADVAKLTKLSPSTVSAIVSELVSAGLVTEAKGAPTGVAGRRPILLSLNAGASLAAIIDVQVTRILYGVIDLAGNPVSIMKEEADLSSPANTVDQILKAAARALSRLPRASAGAAAGIGVAVPGMVDTRTGVILRSTRLRWVNLALAQRLEREFGLPVLVERDVRAAAWGERCYGHARNVADFVYVTVGEGGFGAGLVMNGKPYVGARMHAGELGHMTVDMRGQRCSCGNIGCLAEVASSAIREWKAGGAGDALVEYTATGLVSLINLLDPELAVLGGDIGSLPEFAARVEAVARERALLAPGQMPRVVSSQLGDMGVALGLAGLVFDKFYWGEALAHDLPAVAERATVSYRS